MSADDSTPRERLEDSLRSPYNPDGPVWDALLKAVAKEVEELEEQRQLVLAAKSVEDADGAQLERLASIFELERETGESLPDFRARVKTALRSQITSGTLEEISEMIAVLMDISTSDIQIAEMTAEGPSFEARIPSQSLSESGISRDLLPDLLNDVSAAGVNGIPVSLTELPTGVARADGHSVVPSTTVDDGYSSSAVPGYSQGDVSGVLLDAGVAIAHGDDVIATTVGPTTGTVITDGEPVASTTTVDDGYSSSAVPGYSQGGS